MPVALFLGEFGKSIPDEGSNTGRVGEVALAPAYGRKGLPTEGGDCGRAGTGLSALGTDSKGRFGEIGESGRVGGGGLLALGNDCWGGFAGDGD